MKVRYSFSSRRAGKLENIRKQKQKHFSVIEKVIDMSDILLEVLDARFVEDTRNPELEEEIQKKAKKIIYVINKSDLFSLRNAELLPSIFVSCKNRKGVRELRDMIKRSASGIKKPEKVVVGVIGYPNTGKSSLINFQMKVGD